MLVPEVPQSYASLFKRVELGLRYFSCTNRKKEDGGIEESGLDIE